MSKRRTFILLRPYIYKYLLHSNKINENGEIFIGGKSIGLMKTTNGFDPHRYLNDVEGKVRVPIDMLYPSIRNRFALVRMWEVEFKDRMLQKTAAFVYAGIPAMAALKHFLEAYDITDEEYSIEAAYKSWQRYKANGKKKKQKLQQAA